MNNTDRSTAHLNAALADLGAAMFPQRRRRFGVTGGVGFWEMSGDKSRELWGQYTSGPMPGVADVRPPIVPRGPRRGKQSSGLDSYTRGAIRRLRRDGDEDAVVAARVIGPLGRSGEMDEGDDVVGALTRPRPRPLGPGGSQVPPTFRQGVDPSYAHLRQPPTLGVRRRGDVTAGPGEDKPSSGVIRPGYRQLT